MQQDDGGVADPAPGDRLNDLAGTRPLTVAVAGAGISGLVAAYELARRGHHVCLIEASGRVGGRILTHRYRGQHAELGAMRIPGSHHYTHHYCRLLKAHLEPFANQDPNTFYRLRGRTVPVSDTAALSDLYHLGDQTPTEVLRNVLLAMALPVSDADSRAHVISGDIANANDAVKSADNTSIRDFILQHTADRERLELLGNVFYLKHVWGASCIAMLREVFNDRTQGLEQIATGMDTLTVGLAELLRRDYAGRVTFHLHAPITGLRVGGRPGSGVEVTFRDGGRQRTEQFEYALCTLPFPALRALTLQGFSTGKLAAIHPARPSGKLAGQRRPRRGRPRRAARVL